MSISWTFWKRSKIFGWKGQGKCLESEKEGKEQTKERLNVYIVEGWSKRCGICILLTAKKEEPYYCGISGQTVVNNIIYYSECNWKFPKRRAIFSNLHAFWLISLHTKFNYCKRNLKKGGKKEIVTSILYENHYNNVWKTLRIDRERICYLARRKRREREIPKIRIKL